MSFFAQNRKILIKLFPKLESDIFDKFEAEEAIEKIISRSGEPTCIYKNKLVHSKHSPFAEAEKLLNSEDDHNTGLFIFFGFGMGYHIEVFIKKYPDSNFAIIEPDIPLFLKCLEFRSYEKIFSSKKVSLLLNPSEKSISSYLTELDKSNIKIIKLRSLYEHYSDYYISIEKRIAQYISRKQINFNTISRFGKLWINNLVCNLDILRKSNGINKLKNKYKGLPVLLIAAGPSINNLSCILKELKKRFIIICVDTSYKFCTDNGIVPDFTVIVDPQYWNTRHLDFTVETDTILISESSTHPRIFRSFKNNIFFCSSLFPLGQYFEKNTNISGKLGAGGSVSTSAWDFAKYLGCSAVYCAGLDLGFPDKQTHFKGSFFENLSYINSNRINTAEVNNFNALNNANPFYVENNSGELTLTDQRLIIYKNWFELQMEESSIKTYNLSEKGVRIEGMDFFESKSLLDFSELPENTRKNFSNKFQVDINKNTEALKLSLNNLANDFNKIISLSKNALKLLSDIRISISNNSDYISYLEKLNQIDTNILDSSSKDIAGFIIYPIFSKIINTIIDKNDITGILNNSETIYNELINASEYHINILNKSNLCISD